MFSVLSMFTSRLDPDDGVWSILGSAVNIFCVSQEVEQKNEGHLQPDSTTSGGGAQWGGPGEQAADPGEHDRFLWCRDGLCQDDEVSASETCVHSWIISGGQRHGHGRSAGAGGTQVTHDHTLEYQNSDSAIS